MLMFYHNTNTIKYICFPILSSKYAHLYNILAHKSISIENLPASLIFQTVLIIFDHLPIEFIFHQEIFGSIMEGKRRPDL